MKSSSFKFLCFALAFALAGGPAMALEDGYSLTGNDIAPIPDAVTTEEFHHQKGTITVQILKRNPINVRWSKDAEAIQTQEIIQNS